jgi:hypothetical protein
MPKPRVPGTHLCIVIGRRDQPGRVWHWHWPKADIVNCTRASEAPARDAGR